MVKELIISIIIFTILFYIVAIKIDKQEEYIKEIEQAIIEQKQETDVYKTILETYQTEGIINE